MVNRPFIYFLHYLCIYYSPTNVFHVINLASPFPRPHSFIYKLTLSIFKTPTNSLHPIFHLSQSTHPFLRPSSKNTTKFRSEVSSPNPDQNTSNGTTHSVHRNHRECHLRAHVPLSCGDILENCKEPLDGRLRGPALHLHAAERFLVDVLRRHQARSLLGRHRQRLRHRRRDRLRGALHHLRAPQDEGIYTVSFRLSLVTVSIAVGNSRLSTARFNRHMLIK
ncbi:unnamed protein product [Linum tenue]|uniref:Uncharacterized protein n=1 Tax=Linum tenue TaxID=586396 RepID=A0AAV0P6V4_9ROSI|nr:unnamed protein product [Linum tenue]CAI0467313.1 unnamed protein product [Linum tenue]